MDLDQAEASTAGISHCAAFAGHQISEIAHIAANQSAQHRRSLEDADKGELQLRAGRAEAERDSFDKGRAPGPGYLMGKTARPRMRRRRWRAAR